MHTHTYTNTHTHASFTTWLQLWRLYYSPFCKVFTWHYVSWTREIEWHVFVVSSALVFTPLCVLSWCCWCCISRYLYPVSTRIAYFFLYSQLFLGSYFVGFIFLHRWCLPHFPYSLNILTKHRIDALSSLAKQVNIIYTQQRPIAK